MDYVSTSIGTKISAPLFLAIGYSGVFGVSASVCVLGLLYLVIIVKESLHLHQGDSAPASPGTPLTTTDQQDYGSNDHITNTTVTGAKTNFVKTSLLFCLESFRTVFKARDGYRRHIVLLGVFNFMCYIFTYNGTEGTHRYTFAKAKYEGWSEQEMSSYLFNYRIAYLVSLWVVIPILTKGLKIQDNLIGIIACLLSATGRTKAQQCNIIHMVSCRIHPSCVHRGLHMVQSWQLCMHVVTSHYHCYKVLRDTVNSQDTR